MTEKRYTIYWRRAERNAPLNKSPWSTTDKAEAERRCKYFNKYYRNARHWVKEK